MKYTLFAIALFYALAPLTAAKASDVGAIVAAVVAAKGAEAAATAADDDDGD